MNKTEEDKFKKDLQDIFRKNTNDLFLKLLIVSFVIIGLYAISQVAGISYIAVSIFISFSAIVCIFVLNNLKKRSK